MRIWHSLHTIYQSCTYLKLCYNFSRNWDDQFQSDLIHFVNIESKNILSKFEKILVNGNFTATTLSIVKLLIKGKHKHVFDRKKILFV